MQKRQLNGINIRYETRGAGRSVLFLHGWGGKLESFAPTVAALSGDFCTVALDLPAHGETDRLAGVWGVEEMADFVLGFIVDREISPCHIVAHSLGGRLAIVLASKYPELVRKVVITGGAGLKKPQSITDRLKNSAIEKLKGVAPDSVKEKLRMAFGSADYKVLDADMRETFKKIVNQDLEPFLPGIKAPTLLIWGENDTETPLDFGKRMEKAIPDAGLVVFEGCGHYAYLEQNARFNAIISNFLSK